MTTTERVTVAPASKPPRVIRRTSAGFPVRKIGNDYRDAAPPDVLTPGNPLLAHFFCGISMVFPPGERFMIASAKAVEDRIEDPQLRAEIDIFVRQEAQHATEHSRANKYLAGLVGLDSEAICREITALWKLIEEHGTPRQRAGFTAATEHFTGFLAEVALSDIELIDSMPDSKAKQMFIWHAIEESEHKAVVFDAYKEIGGSEFERIAIMAVYSGPVIVAGLLPVLRLIVAHRELTSVSMWRAGWSMLGRRWAVPIVKGYLHYYRPGFHPNHSPTRHLEQYWRTRLNIVDDGKRTTP